MKRPSLKLVGRVAVTALVLCLAWYAGRWLWTHYNTAPWTRDGRIRSDIAQVAPDVSGLVTAVYIKTDQPVHAGQVLFVIDRPRFELAAAQADAAVETAQAALQQAIRESHRNQELDGLVTAEQVEQGTSKVEQLRAQRDAALVQRNLARLNLQRTTVSAPINGVVTNLDLQPGDYASAGRPVMALVNTDAFYADGYFEETKLPQIQVGDPATVQIMGVKTSLRGKVESIAAGIEDRERTPSSNNLANVNPTFAWVRLAQRVPVRIKLSDVPKSLRLIAGRTATVSIQVPAGRPLEGTR